MSATTIQGIDQVEALTALDRCSGCSAQAYVKIEHIDYGDFLFCVHHWKKNEAALRPGAVTVHDESYKLEPQPYNPATDND